MTKYHTLLTKKQKQFLDVLKKYVAKHKQSPTVGELVKLLSASSPRAVTQYLDALERRGLIRRRRYEARGIELLDREEFGQTSTVTVPVVASAGCDDMSIFADRRFDEYVCVDKQLLESRRLENVVCIRAVGNSMDEAGINEGDYVLVEMTEAVQENDLIVAIVDGFAVIKKLERANNAIILRPVSSDPQYKPIILNKNFRIFGKVIDIIRRAPQGDLEIVPLVSNY